ncbi:MAG: Nif3-like dinuclear metal center hexameric protein [Chloroflexi bacterium]|nr:Nif3-like dinuclear metal center hexameric protein [Chloroflexota bacterium]
MANRDEIIQFLDEHLEVSRIRDYGPNGLQVIGKPEVQKIVVGVSASLDLFRQAASRSADMIIVHHGLFWENTPRPIKTLMRDRLKILFDREMTLLAYHLPLDRHPEVGNNIQILRRLGLDLVSAELGRHDGTFIGVIGRLPRRKPFDDFVKLVNRAIGDAVVVLPFGPSQAHVVGIVSGGGAGDILEAAEKGCDVFLTGEPKEPTTALAKEMGMNFIAAGHYNTERLGVEALGDLVEEKFGVPVDFIDIPNPV